MKKETETVLRRHTRHLAARWSLADGTICHSTTAATGRTRSGLRTALRRILHSTPEAA